MSKALVTGGSGFIGRHLVSALLARGNSVRIFDQAASPETGEGAEFLQGSVLDRASLMHALEGVDCVYHLAGIAHLWRPHQEDFDRVNRVGTETLLSAAAEKRIGRVVHCSTEAVLLPPKKSRVLIDENVSLKLEDMAGPYTRSKYSAEQAALEAAGKGEPVVVVNPSLPIGPGDHRLTPPSAMIMRLIEGRVPVSMDFILNLIDVRDIAAGMLLAAERGRPGERYILGGENMSMRDLASLVERLTGKYPVSIWIPPTLAIAAGFVGEWLAGITSRMPAATLEGVQLALRAGPLDTSKARREIGFAPRPIEPALAQAVIWLDKQRGGATTN